MYSCACRFSGQYLPVGSRPLFPGGSERANAPLGKPDFVEKMGEDLDACLEQAETSVTTLYLRCTETRSQHSALVAFYIWVSPFRCSARSGLIVIRLPASAWLLGPGAFWQRCVNEWGTVSIAASDPVTHSRWLPTPRPTHPVERWRLPCADELLQRPEGNVKDCGDFLS